MSFEVDSLSFGRGLLDGEMAEGYREGSIRGLWDGERTQEGVCGMGRGLRKGTVGWGEG